MRWALVLIGLVSFAFLNHFFISPRNTLANLISLEPIEKPKIIRQWDRDWLVTKVYSTYPFNHRDFLTVNAGSEDGVEVGMPVTVDGKTFFGKIVEVLDRQSVVQTIFDGRFSLAVRVGARAVDSLLVGGPEPILTLLPKDMEILVGEAVYSSGKEFPYGLKLGVSGSTRDSDKNLFREAKLIVDYEPTDLREIIILKDVRS